jgi:hypothetical protein
MRLLMKNSSPARGGGPRGVSRVVEGARDSAASLLAALASLAPSTKPLRVLAPLPVPGRIWA